MLSRKQDWVRGMARLISSTSTTLAMTGPGLSSNSPVFWLNTCRPTTSEGSRSGVHWMRAKLPSRERAVARASRVLPTPGTSSIRTWPSQRSAMKISSIASARPMTAAPTLA